MLTVIGSYFSRLVTTPGGRQFLLLAAVVILFVLLMQKCGDAKELERLKAQNEASTKAMQVVKTKSGKASYERALYEGTAKQLKKANDSLYKALKDEKGNVKIITIIKPVFSQPSVTMDNKLVWLNDSMKGLEWEHKTAYRYIKGLSTFKFVKGVDSYRFGAGTTTILNDSLKFELVTGLKEENGIFKIFVTPKTPNLVISSLEGAIIDKASLFGPPKSPLVTPASKNRGGIGVGIGIGVMPTIGTNGIGLKVGPTISIGYNFNFIKF